ncbi:hypothetical protein KAU11_06400, partial [Candidatus Babeliales bacterium]|nr:hypothetical protein [Candidatus Babeliales bacterium]
FTQELAVAEVVSKLSPSLFNYYHIVISKVYINKGLMESTCIRLIVNNPPSSLGRMRGLQYA